jgi:predicted nucleic acid-binding Zn ribbon protein
MTHRRRGPRPLNLALTPLERQLAPESLLADIQRRWRSTVGDLLAEHTAPTAERGGTVTVSCSAAVWAQELDLMAPQVLRALNAELDPGRAGHSGRLNRLKCTAKGL